MVVIVIDRSLNDPLPPVSVSSFSEKTSPESTVNFSQEGLGDGALGGGGVEDAPESEETPKSGSTWGFPKAPRIRSILYWGQPFGTIWASCWLKLASSLEAYS